MKKNKLKYVQHVCSRFYSIVSQCAFKNIETEAVFTKRNEQ